MSSFTSKLENDSSVTNQANQLPKQAPNSGTLAGRKVAKTAPLPKGQLPKVKGTKAAKLGLGAAIKQMIKSITGELKQVFWAKRTQVVIPSIEATNQAVMEIAAKQKVSPEQVVENFNRAGETMQTIATTLAQLEQFERPSSKLMKFQDQLRGLANQLGESMMTFAQAEGVVSVFETVSDADEKNIEEAFEKFDAKKGMALGLANFENTTKEAQEAMKAVTDAVEAGRPVDEESLRAALQYANEAMAMMTKAQEAEKPLIKLAKKDTLKSRLAKKIAGNKSRLSALVKGAAEQPKVQELLEEAKRKQEIENVRAEKAPDTERVQFAQEVIDELKAHEKMIEEGPKAELSIDQLSFDEQELVKQLQYCLECEEDGVDPAVKERMEDFVNRGLRLKRAVAGKPLEQMSDDQKFDLAQLFIEHLVFYYDGNLSANKALKAGNPDLYRTRSAHIKKGIMGAYQAVWKTILNPICKEKADRIELFKYVDADRGEGAGDVADRMEKVWQQAWDLYFEICALNNQTSNYPKADVELFLGNEKLY